MLAVLPKVRLVAPRALRETKFLTICGRGCSILNIRWHDYIIPNRLRM